MKELIDNESDNFNQQELHTYYNYIRDMVWQKAGNAIIKTEIRNGETTFVFRKAAIFNYLGKKREESSRSFEKFLNGDDNVIPDTIRKIRTDFKLVVKRIDDFIADEKLFASYKNFDFPKKIIAELNAQQASKKKTGKKAYFLQGEYTVYSLCSNKIAVEKNHIIINSKEDVQCMSPHTQNEDDYKYTGTVENFKGHYVNITLDYDNHFANPFFIDYYFELEEDKRIEDKKLINGIRVMRSSYKNLPYATRFVIFNGIHGKKQYEEFALFPLSYDEDGNLQYDESAYEHTQNFLNELKNENVRKVFEMFTGDEYNILIAFDKNKEFKREIKYDSLFYNTALKLGERLKSEKHNAGYRKDLIKRIKYCLNKAVKNGLRDPKKIANIKKQTGRGGIFSREEIKDDLVFVRNDFFYVRTLFLGIKENENMPSR